MSVDNRIDVKWDDVNKQEDTFRDVDGVGIPLARAEHQFWELDPLVDGGLRKPRITVWCRVKSVVTRNRCAEMCLAVLESMEANPVSQRCAWFGWIFLRSQVTGQLDTVLIGGKRRCAWRMARALHENDVVWIDDPALREPDMWRIFSCGESERCDMGVLSVRSFLEYTDDTDVLYSHQEPRHVAPM